MRIWVWISPTHIKSWKDSIAAASVTPVLRMEWRKTGRSLNLPDSQPSQINELQVQSKTPARQSSNGEWERKTPSVNSTSGLSMNMHMHACNHTNNCVHHTHKTHNTVPESCMYVYVYVISYFLLSWLATPWVGFHHLNYLFKFGVMRPGVATHSCNPSIQDAEARLLLFWSQHGLHSKF